jgi:hypothetical protein
VELALRQKPRKSNQQGLNQLRHDTNSGEHKGEDVERTEKASTATAGRHVSSAKGGLQVAAERKASNETARKEHQESWDSDKKSVVPERRK